MNDNATHIGEILAVADTADLRSYLVGQIESYELIAEITQDLMLVSEAVGDILEELPEFGFHKLCQAEISNRIPASPSVALELPGRLRARAVDTMAASIALRQLRDADEGDSN